MTDTFEIGATVESMATLDSLGITRPLDEPVEAAAEISLADGSTRGIGFPISAWHWDLMSKTQYDILEAYFTASRTVTLFIKTRDENDDYYVYETLATFPSVIEWTVGNAAGRKVIDFTITFKRMVIQV